MMQWLILHLYTLLVSVSTLCVERVAGAPYPFSPLQQRDPTLTCNEPYQPPGVNEVECRLALDTMSQDPAIKTFNRPPELDQSDPAALRETVRTDFTDPNSPKTYLEHVPEFPRSFLSGKLLHVDQSPLS